MTFTVSYRIGDNITEDAKIDAVSSRQISNAVELLGGHMFCVDCRGSEVTEQDREFNRLKEKVIEILECSEERFTDELYELVDFVENK